MTSSHTQAWPATLGGVHGTTLTSEGARRHPPRAAIEDSLISAGYTLADVRGAPDRTGSELVFIARKPAAVSKSSES